MIRHYYLRYLTEVSSVEMFRFLALYKGLVPKIMRLGPGGAIMLLVYESVHDYLVKKYPD